MIRKDKAFSLVELLVVMSIIAVLLSMLMPALRKGREQGKRVVCASNLRQCGLAFKIYANHYADYLPPFLDYLKTPQLPWNKALVDMHAMTKKELVCPTFWPYEFVENHKSPSGWIQLGPYENTYGMNATLYSYIIKSGWYQLLCPRLNDLGGKIPANVIFATDSYYPLRDTADNRGAQTYYVNNYETDGGGADPHYVHFRHLNKTNVLFADSSVRVEDMNDLSKPVYLPRNNITKPLNFWPRK